MNVFTLMGIEKALGMGPNNIENVLRSSSKQRTDGSRKNNGVLFIHSNS